MPATIHTLKTLVLQLLMTFFCLQGTSQTYLYFQDSPTEEYYDYSWMELTAPSELERKGAELRRFPVESQTLPVQGTNCLRLKWKSLEGGAWVAIAAGTNWTEKNISATDTLLFWLYSVEGITSENLPLIFMEDITNAKTTKHDFSDWCGDLPAGQWVKVTIPMTLFLNAGDPVDFTKIKTIGFAQHTSDGIEHTLFIDNMRVYTGNGASLPASRPGGVSALGYDSHIEVSWKLNPEASVSGYALQRSADGGNTFSTIVITGSQDSIYVDHVRALGTEVTLHYRLSALNGLGELSVPSDTVNASTRIFNDEELLDMVQQYTFRYFWDFAHPSSGMARERNTSGDVVTSGGTGFGIMAIPVGIERGYITRQAGIERMLKILDFLENADRFHGAWPHWLNGNTGKVVPFSTYDNGGDLVETAFLVEGLLTARKYFNQMTPEEEEIDQRITALWNAVEWDWYRKSESDVLYWHWSPNYGWQINMQIRGWNEAAIIYILAIASPSHSVPSSLWDSGWAGMSYYLNGKSFYGYKLDVGWDKGGPLFFAHYSFLGLDPRNKKDNYTNYFLNNRNHTLINRAYCIDNPLDFNGYGENCWGLTASDDPDGYLAHEPVSGRDNGTITPTAAISSMPYTPEESINALKYLYRNLGNRTWGPMGFYDAFNQERNWYADSYLAIDQGPIIGMIENYRSGLLWENFMANEEISPALEAIGFTEDLTTGFKETKGGMKLAAFPNPMHVEGTFEINLEESCMVHLSITDITGRRLSLMFSGTLPAGNHRFMLNAGTISPGLYFARLVSGALQENISFIIQ
jgi:hypothetical protein